MYFFLQVDSHCPVHADHLIRADARVRGNVAARIRDAHIGGIVAHRVMRSFPRRCH